MKVGIALDGLLCETAPLRDEWVRRLGDERFLQDNDFWVALKAYEDVEEFGKIVANWDLYVLAERPKAVFLPTRAWLRKATGITLNKNRLIMQALKRYDCRVNGINVFIDSDPDVIENLKIETVAPIRAYHLDRDAGASLPELARQIERECEGIRNRS